MRLINYLNEADDLTINLKQIEMNCKPYLNDLSKINKLQHLLFSGRMEHEPFIHKKVRKNREPRDTPIEIHNGLDDWFEEKFGVRARSNSVFTTPSTEDADTYGTPYIMFPTGNYEIIGNPEIGDLYGFTVRRRVLFETISKKPLSKLNPDELDPDDYKYLSDIFEYRKGRLKDALEYGTEIMLICKSYFGLSLKVRDSTIERIEDGLQEQGINLHPKALEL